MEQRPPPSDPIAKVINIAFASACAVGLLGLTIWGILEAKTAAQWRDAVGVLIIALVWAHILLLRAQAKHRWAFKGAMLCLALMAFLSGWIISRTSGWDQLIPWLWLGVAALAGWQAVRRRAAQRGANGPLGPP
jgi:hypothetical protein